MEFNKNLVYLKKKKYLNFLLRSVCIITRMPSYETPTSVIPDKYIVLLEWTYTAAFYGFSCFVFYDLIYVKSSLKPFVDNFTMDSINYVLITALSLGIVALNPLLACRAHENREKYFQLWREYQVQYERYTFSKLDLGSSSFIISLVVCGIIVTALELASNCVLTSQTTPVYVYAYWLIYFYTNFTTVLWVTDCHLLANASEKLIDRLLATAATSSDKTGVALEPRVFGRYVELWRKLSDMTGRLIETGRGQYELNFFIQSVIVIQASYGIAGLYIGQRQSIHYNIYFPTAVWSILNLIVLCEAAYSVTTQVGFKTKVAIQSMACSKFSLETQEQIFTALKTIQSDAPEITVSGYFTMDRAYITAYLGVAISYIIVLVQFKIGTL